MAEWRPTGARTCLASAVWYEGKRDTQSGWEPVRPTRRWRTASPPQGLLLIDLTWLESDAPATRLLVKGARVARCSVWSALSAIS